MIRSYKTLVGILSSVMLGCGSAAPPDPVVITSSSCPTSPISGRTVVGCGLAPRVALLGVDEQAFYVVSGNRTFFQVARDTGQPTKLYHSQAFNYYPSEAATQLVSTGFQGATIYLLDEFIKDGFLNSAIMSLDGRIPGSPSLVVRVGAQPACVFADGYAYFQDRLTPPPGVPRPLMRVPLGGGASQVVYAGEVNPFAVHGGYVYFLTVHNAVHRAPVTGGADNMILPKLPRSSGPTSPSIYYRDLAVDDNYLYVPVPSLGGGAPHTLQRFAVTGGDSGTVVATFDTKVEVPRGPPTALRIDGDYVYFLLSHELTRVKLGGDGHLEFLGTTNAPPSFDATSIYLTEQLGGEDAPLQSIIVRIPK